VTDVWTTVAVLFVGTFATKAVGPAAVGGASLSGRTSAVIALLAPALLAALVAYETFGGHGQGLIIDARLGGLAVAAAALALRLPLLVVVTVAALATALLRAVG
jgi:uncharacterized membrane protein